MAERAALLDRIADLLQRDKESAGAGWKHVDTGKTLAESRIDIDDVTSVFRYYARLAGVESDRLVDVGDPAVISRVVREPIGVCVLIAPWNYPLLQMSWKIAPALAAGCTMVAKPSEVTPLTTIAFVHLLDEAGVPPSVVNLVQGSGATLGAALTDNPDVDFISFTGGLATGRTIAKVAAEHVTKVAVELGGKNPHIVFADADWESVGGPGADRGVPALRAGVLGGHPADRRGVDRRRLRRRTRRAGREDPRSATAWTRPARPARWSPSSTAPRWKPMSQLGISEGAKLVTGGARPTRPGAGARAASTCPRSSTGATGRCESSRRRRSGRSSRWSGSPPRPRRSRLGNDTEYGLAAGVRTSDPARGERVVRALRHGTVWLNDFGYYTAAAEWGGFGKSGNGRELGPTGLAEYQEIKHIWHNTAPTARRLVQGLDRRRASRHGHSEDSR